MAENYLFKKRTTEDYIALAEETARWLKTNEFATPNGKRWKQAPDSKEDFSDYPMLTEKALYGGSAGIGLFYLRLYQATGNAEYLAEARAAAADIIATDEGVGFYERTLHMSGTEDKRVHVKNMPGWAIGPGNGPSGGAYLALKLYEVTHEAVYKEFAIKVADDLLAAAKEVPEGIYWSEQGDLTGDAGFIPFLVSVFAATRNEKYLKAAHAVGKFLVPKGRPAPRGGKFWNVVDLTIINFPKDVFWVNLAHGTSGMGLAFAILYRATKDEVFLEAAKAAAAYIKGLAVGDEDAVLVPYLDSLDRGPSTEFYYLSTCHGPAGTALLFKALYKITHEPEDLAWVKKLSRGLIKAGAPERYSRGYWKSQALCCGAPGLLEHFVGVYRLTGEEEFLAYAVRAAEVVVGESFVDDSPDIYKAATSRRWLGNWWRTIPSEVHSYTGLGLGSAGNAWTLLSLAAVLKRERYIEIL